MVAWIPLRSVRGLGLVLGLWLAAAPAGALTILLEERSLFAEAQASSATDFDSDFDEDLATGGAFSASVTAMASVEGVSGAALASQVSSVGAEELSATGAGSAGAAATRGVFGPGGFAGESRFDVVFAPEVQGPVLLVAELDSSEAGGDGFASVSLVRIAALGPDVVLAAALATEGEDATLEFAGVLELGETYRLTALALGAALVNEFDPTAQGGATFEVRLQAILPEPGAVWLLALAGSCLILWRRP